MHYIAVYQGSMSYFVVDNVVVTKSKLFLPYAHVESHLRSCSLDMGMSAR